MVEWFQTASIFIVEVTLFFKSFINYISWGCNWFAKVSITGTDSWFKDKINSPGIHQVHLIHSSCHIWLISNKVHEVDVEAFTANAGRPGPLLWPKRMILACKGTCLVAYFKRIAKPK